MATDLENLQTARTALTASIALYAGDPNYVVNGVTVNYGELIDRLSKLDGLISQYEGPAVVVSEGY